MTCNNCNHFSIGKLKVKIKTINKRAYYFIRLLKCMKLNIILRTVRENQGLEDIEIPKIFPIWDCPGLCELRKDGEIPQIELTVLNGYTNNDFTEWVKSN